MASKYGSGFYDKMEFPDYSYNEWPRAIAIDEDGKPTKDPYVPGSKPKKLRDVVTVNSEAELEALLEGAVEVVDGKIRTEDDEKDDLITEAAQVGAQVDKKWSPDRMRKAIDAKRAEAQPL
jgi:hypothetical protein